MIREAYLKQKNRWKKQGKTEKDTYKRQCLSDALPLRVWGRYAASRLLFLSLLHLCPCVSKTTAKRCYKHALTVSFLQLQYPEDLSLSKRMISSLPVGKKSSFSQCWGWVQCASKQCVSDNHVLFAYEPCTVYLYTAFSSHLLRVCFTEIVCLFTEFVSKQVQIALYMNKFVFYGSILPYMMFSRCSISVFL